MLRAARPLRSVVLAVLAAPLLLLAAPPPVALAHVPPDVAPDLGAAASTTFGSSVQLRTGEHYDDGVDRVEDASGRLGVVRVFQDVPSPGIFSQIDNRSGVVSFKLPPGQVLSGRYDREFRAFFAAAPTRHVTWWSYYHEADVAYQQRELRDLDQYRRAYQHVLLLAERADNPRLRNALILVGYTANPRSGLRVQQFMPARRDLVDVVAWDNYNTWFTDQRTYGDPREMVEADRRAADAVGRPFAVAEFASLVIGRDTAGRADWILRFSRAARAQGARFVAYYDSNQYGKGPDYRLLDRPSQLAYRAVLGWD